MKRSLQDDCRIEKQYASYVCRVLRNELMNDAKENQLRLNREVSLSDLTLELAAENDHYFANDYIIHVQGIDIELENASLAQAIRMLSPRKQEIITLYYILQLPDNSIAQALGLHRNSVLQSRHKALTELKQFLEEYDYDD